MNFRLLQFVVIVIVFIQTALIAQEDSTRFRILDANEAALRARIYTIANAQKDIISSYFIVSNDITSLGGFALMREASRERGVRGRTIVDAPFHRISRALMKHLLDENVELRVHHPLDWRHPLWSLQRMHDKYIVADGRIGIFGGRNMDKSYYGLAPKNYLDRDVWISGAPIQSLNEYYERFWRSDHVRLPSLYGVTAAEAANAGGELDRALDTIRKNDWLNLDKIKPLNASDNHHGHLEIITDDIAGKKRDVTEVREALYDAILSAKKSIIIETPYFIPTPRLVELLKTAVARGIKVTVLTSSVKSNDGFLPAGGYLRYRDELAATGVTIYEYQGPEALHAKSAVVDQAIAIISSFNLDPRSAYLNSETATISHDPRFARQLHASINEHIRRGAVLVAENGKVRPGIKDFEGVALPKRALIQCSRLLAPLLRGQL